MRIGRRRRLAWTLGAAAAAVLAAVALALLVPVRGPTRGVQPYAVSRVLRSAALERCITVSVRGELVGTRSERFAAVRWSGVRVVGPTVIAEGSLLDHGRCDRSRTWRMRAVLAQTWTADGAAVGTRSTDQGPATGPLRQFNSGTPIVVPDVLRLRSPGAAPALELRALVSVTARTAAAEDAVRLPVEVVLR
ncbi:hypothetical protein [Amnibacterium soli]